MDDIQRIKEQFEKDLRYWTGELERGKELKRKAKNYPMYKAAKAVIGDAKKGIKETETKLAELKKIKEKLRALAVFKPVREVV